MNATKSTKGATGLAAKWLLTVLKDGVNNLRVFTGRLPQALINLMLNPLLNHLIRFSTPNPRGSGRHRDARLIMQTVIHL